MIFECILICSLQSLQSLLVGGWNSRRNYLIVHQLYNFLIEGYHDQISSFGTRTSQYFPTSKSRKINIHTMDDGVELLLFDVGNYSSQPLQ